VIRLALAALLALVLAAPAAAGEQNPTLPELERELVCPTCKQSLALSNAPIADRMRSFIRERIAAGDTKSEIKDKLVAQFGEGVLAAPPASGFNILAWALPLIGIVLAAMILGLLARRWRRRYGEPSPDPGANGRPPLEPDLERRLDEELARFES
jgi:cytochrome c-type biogenesis protein CcmH